MANAAPVLVWVAGDDGRCTWFNQRWLAFTGRSLDDEHVEAWGQGLHPEDSSRCLEAYRAAFDAREPFEMEYRLRHRDGSFRWVLDQASPIYSPSGDFTGFIGSCIDITDRRQAEQALQFLTDAGSILAASLELDAVLDAFARLSVPRFADWCTVEFLSRDGSIHSRVAHADASEASVITGVRESLQAPVTSQLPLLQRVWQGEEVLLSTLDLQVSGPGAVGADGGELVASLGAASVIGLPMQATGRRTGAILFARRAPARAYSDHDVSVARQLVHRAALSLESAALYEQSRHMEADLRIANDAKDDFLETMSHELRTPLTVISGGARLLLSRHHQLDEPTRAGVYADIEHESERLFRMVENLLSLATLDPSGHPDVEPVHLARALGRAVDTFCRRNPSRNVRLRHSRTAHTVMAEPTHLDQVLRNLLSNAGKYSPPDAPIEVQAAPGPDGAAVIRVLDRGPGVAPEEVELIFERFYRSRRTASMVGGSGVGLALCKRLVTAMGGTIWAKPRPRGGLEVGLTLPLHEELNREY